MEGRATTANFPENGFIMDIVITVDIDFKDKYGGTEASAKAKIESLMTHVQNFYNLKDSLGTTIEIRVKRIEFSDTDYSPNNQVNLE